MNTATATQKQKAKTTLPEDKTMCKSESIKNIAIALSKAQGEFDHAKKDVKNDFFKSRYADLASVIDAAKKPLADNGLSVSQVVDLAESGDLVLETILMHISGEFISGRYPIRPVKTDPQSTGSAITYARRYAFSAITGIAADDDDGNAASNQQQAPARAITPPRETAPDYEKLINSAKSRPELIAAWNSIPKEKQKDYEALVAKAGAKFPKLTEAVA